MNTYQSIVGFFTAIWKTKNHSGIFWKSSANAKNISWTENGQRRLASPMLQPPLETLWSRLWSLGKEELKRKKRWRQQNQQSFSDVDSVETSSPKIGDLQCTCAHVMRNTKHLIFPIPTVNKQPWPWQPLFNKPLQHTDWSILYFIS